MKTVIVGLLLATLVAGAGIAARVDHRDGVREPTQIKNPGGRIIKASEPLSRSGQPPILW
jgi:hypothetical protein